MQLGGYLVIILEILTLPVLVDSRSYEKYRDKARRHKTRHKTRHPLKYKDCGKSEEGLFENVLLYWHFLTKFKLQDQFTQSWLSVSKAVRLHLTWAFAIQTNPSDFPHNLENPPDI